MPLMKCGCASNATYENNKPCCAIHIGITEDACIVAENQPPLEGRKAQCIYCKKKKISKLELPFFVYHAEKKFDSYYCGCLGWN